MPDNPIAADKQPERQQHAEGTPVPVVDVHEAPQPEHRGRDHDEESKRQQRIASIAKKRRGDRRKEQAKFWAEFFGALATVALVGLTFVYVHYSRKQWHVMSDQLAEMRSARRPWIMTIKAESFIGLPLADEPKRTSNLDHSSFKLVVKNVGNVPGQQVGISATWTMWATAIVNRQGGNWQCLAVPTVIGPEVESLTSVIFYGMEGGLSPYVIRELVDKDGWFCIHGSASYVDQFGVRLSSPFCFEWTSISYGFYGCSPTRAAEFEERDRQNGDKCAMPPMPPPDDTPRQQEPSPELQ